MPTGIDYLDETWNWVTGCSHVSDGCRFCYAERLSLKKGWSQKPWTDQHADLNVKLHAERLDIPKHWRTPKRIMVSMGDPFHDLVTDSFLHRVFDVVEACPQHTFLFLTKRAERLPTWIRWPANAWAGVSVEDRRVINRIVRLIECTAGKKFISFEPLIGAIPDISLEGIDLAIVGGESGPHQAERRTERPMDMAWARAIRDMCHRDHVAFFFKQDACIQSGARPYLVEENGKHTVYHQWPGDVLDTPAAKPELQQLLLF